MGLNQNQKKRGKYETENTNFRCIIFYNFVFFTRKCQNHIGIQSYFGKIKIINGKY